MNITTADMLNGLTEYLTVQIPTATSSRQFVEMGDLSVSKGGFPRVMVLLGGGEQNEISRPLLDEQTEVVLVLYVHDQTSAEDALLSLFGNVLTALQSGFTYNAINYDAILDGNYSTDRQSAKPYGWLVKKVTVSQRFS